MILKDLKKDIRKSTPKQNDDGCYICGKRHTENNHLIRVVDHAEICWANQYFDVGSLYVPSC